MRGLTLFVLFLPIVLLGCAGPPAGEDVGVPPYFGSTYRLERGEEVTGDRVILATSAAMLEPGSRIKGDVTVISETILIRGAITGDLTVAARSVALDRGAFVGGTITACTPELREEQGFERVGEIVESCAGLKTLLEGVDPEELRDFDLESFGIAWPAIERPQTDGIGAGIPWDFLLHLVQNIILTLLAGGAAIIVNVLFPERRAQVVRAVVHAPWAMFGTGGLTIAVALLGTLAYGASLALCLPAILLPVVGFAWLVLGLSVVAGWTSLGSAWGAWLWEKIKAPPLDPIALSAAGSMVLTGVIGLFDLFPETRWVAVAVALVIAALGVGSILMTRFGGRPYIALRISIERGEGED
jgi:hypothetical protein